mgnify:FL=1
MTRLKRWIIDKFLPAWCRSELMEENRRLTEKMEKQAAKIDRLNAYIDGLQDALCRQPKIIINGGDASGNHERNL